MIHDSRLAIEAGCLGSGRMERNFLSRRIVLPIVPDYLKEQP
jgi:hypothetical protein